MIALSGNNDEEIERARDTRRNIDIDGRALARRRIARRRRYRKLIRDVVFFVAASAVYAIVVFFGVIAVLLECGPGSGTCNAANDFSVAAAIFYAVLSAGYWFGYWWRHWHSRG